MAERTVLFPQFSLENNKINLLSKQYQEDISEKNAWPFLWH